MDTELISKLSMSGPSHNQVLRGFKLAVFRLILGNVYANIQNMKTGIKSKHVHTRDTCVVFSWPITLHNSAINFLISYNTS